MQKMRSKIEAEQQKKEKIMIKNNIDVTFSEDGSIVDVISGQLLKDTPEERVRQKRRIQQSLV